MKKHNNHLSIIDNQLQGPQKLKDEPIKDFQGCFRLDFTVVLRF